MALQQPSPAVTMDNSPAESFLSTPSDNFPSLFAASSPADTVNPMDMMTPQPSADDGLSAIPEDEPVSAGSPSDKKPTKKRKSWGQVLPEPKTNLPPRKRAKTDDEKEQRRVERVLRNRRAAQSSRERKRLEVEALEERNKELENMLNSARQANLMLVEELNRFRRDSGVATRTASPFDSMRDNQVTLSQELFRPQDDLNMAPGSEQSGNALIEELVLSTNPTVNPASLSPELGPVPDVADDNENPSTSLPEDVVAAKPTESAAPSSDLTQYPAAMLCDLQCQVSEEQAKPFPASQTLMSPLLALTLQLRMLLLSASAILSACQRPLTQIAMSSKAGFSLLPSPLILTTIIWLVTLPPDSNSSTSTTSSATKQTTSPLTLWQRAMTPLRTTTASSRKYTTLRLKSLRKILTSSPNLARPLSDATMVALRLVSEGRDDRVGHLPNGPRATREVDSELTQCLSNIVLPSKEVLMTLLWALKVEERRIWIRQQSGNAATVRPVGIAPHDNYKPTNKHSIKIRGMKRSVSESNGSRKRNRFS
jgi:transcriptional activator HAC1